MHSTGSCILTCLEKIRGLLNDPDLDAKYSNDYITRHILGPASVDVFSRINTSSQNPIIVRNTLSLAVNTEYYQLPPCVEHVKRICKRNSTTGELQWDWRPYSDEAPVGPGWILEGNLLCIRPVLPQALTCELWYIPNSTIAPHYSSAGGAVSSATSADTITLASSPTLGGLDKREKAYEGQILRCLTGSVWQERIITSYDAATRVATLRTPLLNLGTTGSIAYEIAPIGHAAWWSAIACRAAETLNAFKRGDRADASLIRSEYQQAIKTIRDNLANLNLRTGSAFDPYTIDNDQIYRI